jgi:hypothetical protein
MVWCRCGPNTTLAIVLGHVGTRVHAEATSISAKSFAPAITRNAETVLLDAHANVVWLRVDVAARGSALALLQTESVTLTCAR